MNATEVFEIKRIFINHQFSEDESEKLVEFMESRSTAEISDLKQIFLTKEDKIEILKTIESLRSDTKDDKIDLMERMDRNFKWTVGILLSTILAIGGTVITLAVLILNKLK